MKPTILQNIIKLITRHYSSLSYGENKVWHNTGADIK